MSILTHCDRCGVEGCNPGCNNWRGKTEPCVSTVEGVPLKMVPPLTDIVSERWRQEDLKASGKFDWSLADILRGPLPDEHHLNAEERARLHGITPAEKLVVLLEEVGEAAQEVCEGLKHGTDHVKLRAELIQVAACCVAWCEALDEEHGR